MFIFEHLIRFYFCFQVAPEMIKLNGRKLTILRDIFFGMPVPSTGIVLTKFCNKKEYRKNLFISKF